MPEFLSPKEREREIRQGYLRGDDGVDSPLVHFLDYTIAGIGYSQILKYLWGTDDEEVFALFYNGALNKLKQSKCTRAGCINCQPSGLLGKGDKVPFMVPRKNVDYNFLKKSTRAKKKRKTLYPSSPFLQRSPCTSISHTIDSVIGSELWIRYECRLDLLR
jgi:hypothetical protein